ncbi:MAG: hypothetical protein RLZZ146_346 [Bacteroidota bacterium]|jgi:hypothetical protein
MNTQPEALRLADLIDKVPYRGTHEAAAELRRLHEVNQELLEALMECPVWGNKAQIAIAKATGE